MLAILIVSICLLLNALLSCAEMAFVTIDKRLLRKEALGGNRSALIIEEMQESPERILSVVQIGITLVGAISAAVSGAGAEESLSPFIMNVLGVSEDTSETISIMLVVLPLTVLSVVIGELVPKSVAIRYSFRICMIFAPALKFAEKLMGFLVNPMEKVTNLLVDTFLGEEKVDSGQTANHEVSLEGLKSEHREYVHNIIDLDSKSVALTMVKWPEVKWIDSHATAQEVNEALLSYGHTRMPVLANGEIYGFIHLKEFLQIMQGGAGENWISYIRPPTFIPSSSKLLNALKVMKISKVQILIVGSAEEPQGILTLEDVIEEVVGDIVDENENKKIVGFMRHMVIRK